MIQGLSFFSQDRSRDKEIRDFPEQDVLFLPIGELSLIPKVGDRVEEAQIFMASSEDNFVYSPISGTFSEIQQHNGVNYAIIKRDPIIAPKKYPLYDPTKNTISERLEFIRKAGIVGMGGEGRSTYKKLYNALGVTDTIVLNALESDPFIFSDYQLIKSKPKEIIQALIQLKRLTKAENIVIAIKADKQLQNLLEKYIYDPSIKVVLFPDVYPQASERLILEFLAKVSIGHDRDPIEFGYLIYNTMTVFAIYEALYHHKPLIDRVITVDGAYCLEYGNFRVKIGTPLSSFMRPFATENAYVMFSNSIMRGSLLDKARSITPVMRAVLIFEGAQEIPKILDCIHCGDCLKSCPMHLNPIKIMDHIQNNENNLAISNGAKECIHCNNCSYICPSHIPLGKTIKDWSMTNPQYKK